MGLSSGPWTPCLVLLPQPMDSFLTLSEPTSASAPWPLEEPALWVPSALLALRTSLPTTKLQQVQEPSFQSWSRCRSRLNTNPWERTFVVPVSETAKHPRKCACHAPPYCTHAQTHKPICSSLVGERRDEKACNYEFTEQKGARPHSPSSIRH